MLCHAPPLPLHLHTCCPHLLPPLPPHHLSFPVHPSIHPSLFLQVPFILSLVSLSSSTVFLFLFAFSIFYLFLVLCFLFPSVLLVFLLFAIYTITCIFCLNMFLLLLGFITLLIYFSISIHPFSYYFLPLYLYFQLLSFTVPSNLPSSLHFTLIYFFYFYPSIWLLFFTSIPVFPVTFLHRSFQSFPSSLHWNLAPPCPSSNPVTKTLESLHT